MLTEPNISKDLILSTIEKSYGLEVTSLSFIKGGEASWGYKVETADKTYFFKIHTGLVEHEKRFALTYRLFTDAHIQHITHPLKTKDNELVVYIDTYPCALFNFIAGHNASEKELDDEKRIALGELLGKIHQAKEVIGDFSLTEDFRYGNIDRLANNLWIAESFSENDSAYKRNTAKLLIDNHDLISKRIQELEATGETLRNLDLELVICHGEPHQWNTMVDTKGDVYLIDWDDSLFAPKEKDLNMIREDALMMQGYRNIVGDTTVNKDVIHYYNMEWNISEIDAWSAKLLFEEANHLQNKHDFDLFATCIEDLKNYSPTHIRVA